MQQRRRRHPAIHVALVEPVRKLRVDPDRPCIAAPRPRRAELLGHAAADPPTRWSHAAQSRRHEASPAVRAHQDSAKEQGASESRAEEIAARTVNKERARSGEARQRSRTSTQDLSSSRRGGQRSGTNRPKGRTRDQLYEEAKNLGVEGRSSMNKAQLERAIAGKKS